MGGGAVMDYLWRGYRPQTSYVLDAAMKDSSPPLEISRRYGATVVMNPLPRFVDIFRELLIRQDLWESQQEDLSALSHCLLHFLAQLDRLTGLSKELLEEDLLHEELERGCFGARIKNIYCGLSPEQRRLVVGFLRKQEMAQGRRLYFREALKAMFPQAHLYYYHTDDVFLIYLPQQENDDDRDCMDLLTMLFLDVSAQWQVYWEHPFGIIGRRQTMRLNRMRLYGKDS